MGTAMLVNELRQAVAFLNQKPPGRQLPTPSMPVHRMLGAAADRIERLEAALKEIAHETCETATELRAYKALSNEQNAPRCCANYPSCYCDQEPQ